ncbi:hypothetical protein AAEX63_07205 [Luteococcus sp. H138]|uniref:hypothetical protein n=1 Tax=unclassified Luteococcus TaxID=2639923 RepID=UPI00313BF470
MFTAAVCFLATALIRWWPCLQDGVGTDACFSHEDDSYEALLCNTWSPQLLLMTAGYLCLTLGIVQVGRIARSRWWLTVGMIIAPLIAAAATWHSPSRLPAVLMTTSWLLTPLLAAFQTADSHIPRWSRICYSVGLTLTILYVDAVLMAPLLAGGYHSHDTTSYTYVGTGLGAFLAASAVSVCLART